MAALADACTRAAAVTGDSTWLTGVEMSVTWLLGDNDAGVPMLEERTGGCSDGLSRTSRSRNQGAELLRRNGVCRPRVLTFEQVSRSTESRNPCSP
jgi:hypothetical protein